jgi:hypothetical protein
MSNKVKIFHSGMTGAPQLSQAAGSMIGILDACLVNGWGTVTASSLVVAGGVATATFASGHPFEVDALALFAGAAPAGLNGEQRILSVTTNTASFATALADQTATGTVTAKLAPAGWDKIFSGASLAAYRSANVASRKPVLRVDDTGTLNARVVGYETMTDINTGAGRTPADVQQSGGLYWPKANNSTGNRPWVVVADDMAFYLYTIPQSSFTNSGFAAFFGEFIANSAVSAYEWLIIGADADASNATSMSAYCGVGANKGNTFELANGSWLPRSYTGLGGAIGAFRQAIGCYASDGFFGNQGYLAYPNGPDNALITNEVLVGQAAHVRGILPGVSVPLQVLSIADFVFLGRVTLGGRKHITLLSGSQTASKTGAFFLDISGEWR